MGHDSDPFHGVCWLPVGTADLHGLLRPDLPRQRPFHRLPSSAQAWIGEMGWHCSTQTAGLWVELDADGTELFARWTLHHALRQAGGETRISAAGLDCYGQDEQKHWCFVGQVDLWKEPTSDGAFTKTPLDGRQRRYRVHLPLSSEVQDLAIGVRGGTKARLLPPGAEPPVIIYGTSIVHGCYASRPGMAFPAQVMRRLGLPVVNLGLAGSALLEPGMASLLADCPARCFVIDSLPNDDHGLIRERYAPFVQTIRQANPSTPIVLVNMPLEADHAFAARRRADCNLQNVVWRQAMAPLFASGDEHLHVVDGGTLLGEDGDGTVDPIHPNDLGMHRLADVYVDALRRAMGC